MSDPFTNSGGSICGGGGIAATDTISAVRLARENAISAYRNNIALPDVHVADREEEFVPLVVGEDGQELTLERRRQLMEEAQVAPMFDSDGKSTGQLYTGVFDDVVTPERLGKTAEANRHGYRFVQPRELEILFEGTVSDKQLKTTTVGGAIEVYSNLQQPAVNAEELYDHIMAACSEITARTHRSPQQIVMHPDTAAMLENPVTCCGIAVRHSVRLPPYRIFITPGAKHRQCCAQIYLSERQFTPIGDTLCLRSTDGNESCDSSPTQ